MHRNRTGYVLALFLALFATSGQAQTQKDAYFDAENVRTPITIIPNRIAVMFRNDVSAERLEQTRQALRQEMHRLAEGSCTAEAATTLRARANSLVLRATQAALTASKGAGFVRPHPAQRRSRQALFFLVWSCPRPAAEAMLRQLAEGSICS